MVLLLMIALNTAVRACISTVVCKGPYQNVRFGVVMASVVSVVMKNARLHKQAATKIRKAKGDALNTAAYDALAKRTYQNMVYALAADARSSLARVLYNMDH